MDTTKLRKRMPVSTLFDLKIVLPAIGQSFVKLNPATLIKNPVIFVLEIVTVLVTVLFLRDLLQHHEGLRFTFQIVLGCGSPCCLRTSPKQWPKGAARRRPTPCGRPAPRRAPNAF